MIKIILSALNDDHGVSEETYHEILASLKMLGLHDFRDFLESHVNATDGRFYLEHDHSHEVTAWSIGHDNDGQIIIYTGVFDLEYAD